MTRPLPFKRHLAAGGRVLLALMIALCPSVPALAGGGRIVGVTKIVDHGSAAERYNIVIIAEGFREIEQATFAARATEYVNYLNATEPFGESWDAINVWRLDVVSNQSGADDPNACGGTGLVVDTYFDAGFCNGGIRRLLMVDNSIAIAALNAYLPEWDQALVIVNSTVYGGSGGSIAVTALAGSWQNVAIHEFGHSGFGLADEYEFWAGCESGETDRDHHPVYEPAQPNITTQANPALVKWAALFDPAVPKPTTENQDCSRCDPRADPYPGVMRTGVYEGAHYYHCDAYRPIFSCMMRNFGPFCPVCRSRITQTLASFLAPALVDLTLSKSAVAGCKSVSGRVTLSAPAPIGGATVTLSDTLVSATPPATVKVAEGATSRSFTINTTPVAANESGTVTASIGAASSSQPLTVRPMGLSAVRLSSTTVVGGQNATGTATLECVAGPGPVTVDLSTSNAVVASPVAPTVVVPQGLKSQTFTVATNSVLSKSNAMITGEASTTTKSRRLNVVPAASVSPTRLQFGSVSIGQTSGSLVATLRNEGVVSFAVSSISLTGTYASWFAQTNSCPANLSPGASCTISVTFRPQAALTKSAKLAIATSATSTPLSVSLSGTGI